jgi:hypothetical protein
MARALGLLLENGVLELATPCGGLTDSKSGINPLWFASWTLRGKRYVRNCHDTEEASC